MSRSTSPAPALAAANASELPPPTPPSFHSTVSKFFVCFVGLQGSYLVWGYMQELIMTTVFIPTPSSPTGHFPSASFCVFSNRFLAVLVAASIVKYRHGSFFPKRSAPLVAFGPCALSNTISSWSQYASLRYVSFPVQTLFKSGKVIPVMIMGTLLKGTKYRTREYAEAMLITVGVFIFSVFTGRGGKAAEGAVGEIGTVAGEEETKGFVGFLFMMLYIFSDSFTSQYQSKVFSDYGKKNVDQYQMMLGVNCCAIIFTAVGLIVSGDLPVLYTFFAANPSALLYNAVTALTSTTGQLFIFYTIKEFGAVAFTIIMTTRQMFSICLSTFMFGHNIDVRGLAGAVIVFAVVLAQVKDKISDDGGKKKGGAKAKEGAETASVEEKKETV